MAFDLSSLFKAKAPPLFGLDISSSSVKMLELVDGAKGGYRVDSRAATGERQELEFAVHEDDFKKPPAAQRLRLVRSQRFDAKNQSLWRVSYDDYRTVQEGVSLPFRVHVEDARHGADALMRFEDIDVNVPIPSGAFSQSPRTGLTIEAVTCD